MYLSIIEFPPNFEYGVDVNSSVGWLKMLEVKSHYVYNFNSGILKLLLFFINKIKYLRQLSGKNLNKRNSTTRIAIEYMYVPTLRFSYQICYSLSFQTGGTKFKRFLPKNQHA